MESKRYKQMEKLLKMMQQVNEIKPVIMRFAIIHGLELGVKCCGTYITFRNFLTDHMGYI
jgi:hypothetical protein